MKHYHKKKKLKEPKWPNGCSSCRYKGSRKIDGYDIDFYLCNETGLIYYGQSEAEGWIPLSATLAGLFASSTIDAIRKAAKSIYK